MNEWCHIQPLATGFVASIINTNQRVNCGPGPQVWSANYMYAGPQVRILPVPPSIGQLYITKLNELSPQHTNLGYDGQYLKTAEPSVFTFGKDLRVGKSHHILAGVCLTLLSRNEPPIQPESTSRLTTSKLATYVRPHAKRCRRERLATYSNRK